MKYIPLRQIASLMKVTVRNWQADKAPRMGAALAYYISLSLAPTVVILVAVVGLAFGAPAAESRFVSLIQSLVGYQGAKAVQTMIEGARQSSRELAASVLGLVNCVFRNFRGGQRAAGRDEHDLEGCLRYDLGHGSQHLQSGKGAASFFRSSAGFWVVSRRIADRERVDFCGR
jgi:hypothetical protein